MPGPPPLSGCRRALRHSLLGRWPPAYLIFVLRLTIRNQSRGAFVSEHISRKELKQDKVRETFEHGAEAVLSHTRLAFIVALIALAAAAGYFSWKIYSERQSAQAQVALDDAMKIFNAQILLPGQPAQPGEISYI